MANIDLIFIDDNKDMTLAWEMAAAAYNKNIVVFNNVDDVRKEILKYAKEIPIYIDSNLISIKGEDFAKELYDLGFRNLYLTTGYDKDYFPQDLYWLKDIIGKEPPFMPK